MKTKKDSTQNVIKLQEFFIKKLFHKYTYNIPLSEDRITLIHGLNGSGKTTILKILNAFFKRDFSYFTTIPFDFFEIKFANKKSVRVYKNRFFFDMNCIEHKNLTGILNKKDFSPLYPPENEKIEEHELNVVFDSLKRRMQNSGLIVEFRNISVIGDWKVYEIEKKEFIKIFNKSESENFEIESNIYNVKKFYVELKKFYDNYEKEYLHSIFLGTSGPRLSENMIKERGDDISLHNPTRSELQKTIGEKVRRIMELNDEIPRKEYSSGLDPDDLRELWELNSELQTNLFNFKYGNFEDGSTDQNKMIRSIPDELNILINNFEDNVEKISRSKVKLIETQRMYQFGSGNDISSRLEKINKELIDQLVDAKEKSYNISLMLDQTFHNRLFKAINQFCPTHGPDAPELKELYTYVRDAIRCIEENKKYFIRLGFLQPDTISDSIQTLDFSVLDYQLLMTLKLYSEDWEEKLVPIQSIYKKIFVFKRFLETFLDKVVIVDLECGLVIYNEKEISSSTQQILLEHLSSGEKHLLIILYDIIFKIPNGSLVLIDEPELSLHISWQKKFVSTLKEILEMENKEHIEIIIATHSPQIINGLWPITIGLGAIE